MFETPVPYGRAVQFTVFNQFIQCKGDFECNCSHMAWNFQMRLQSGVLHTRLKEEVWYIVRKKTVHKYKVSLLQSSFY